MVVKLLIIVTSRWSPWTWQLSLHCSSGCIKATTTGNGELNSMLKELSSTAASYGLFSLLSPTPKDFDAKLSPSPALQQRVWHKRPPESYRKI